MKPIARTFQLSDSIDIPFWKSFGMYPGLTLLAISYEHEWHEPEQKKKTTRTFVVNLFEMRCELQVTWLWCIGFFISVYLSEWFFEHTMGGCHLLNALHIRFLNNQMVFVILFDFSAISWHFGHAAQSFFFSYPWLFRWPHRVNMSGTHFNSV